MMTPPPLRGGTKLRVMSWNIGAVDGFGPEKASKFMGKVSSTVERIAPLCDVMLLQEVGDQFRADVVGILERLSFHVVVRSKMLIALGAPWRMVSTDDPQVFPDPQDSTSKHRFWRTFCVMRAKAPDGSAWQFACAHTVSGGSKAEGEDHDIPGRSPEARESFKQLALSNIVRQVRQMGPNCIVGGDFNLQTDSMGRGAGKDTHGLGSMHMVGHPKPPAEQTRGPTDRDWILGSRPLQMVQNVESGIAWDIFSSSRAVF